MRRAGSVCRDVLSPLLHGASQPGAGWIGHERFWREIVVFKMAPTTHRIIVLLLLQHFGALFSVLLQIHGLLYIYMLYRKRNNDLLVGHFALKRNLIVRKCK